MRLTKIIVNNFRLLENIEINLEPGTTLIVGRNNSGKTSLTELFRRLLDEGRTEFRLEDFSLNSHAQFWTALSRYESSEDEEEIRNSLPEISVTLDIEYEFDEDFGPLSDFVVDLNEDCLTARILMVYRLRAGKITEFFEGSDSTGRRETFRIFRDRIPKMYSANLFAVDPNDSENTRELDPANLRSVVQFGFINAQRALDNPSVREKAVLGKIFEKLFVAAASSSASADDQSRAEELETAVSGVQAQIDTDFNARLSELAPAFDLFGYPGLADPQLRTETTLSVTQLLSNHTTVSYLGPDPDGVNLPESYNGLGSRNLIFILLKLYEFFREFTNRQHQAATHIIFIEEPEAHLHPQMQAVFIRKLSEIRQMFESEYNDDNLWPVQFVVTTHSSHIANEGAFDSMRYFRTVPTELGNLVRRTEPRDLRTGLHGQEEVVRAFLHQYMTLTRCDLLFADAAILIEGTTERLLLPKIIEKFDSETSARLGRRYLTIMEVGGAYAHLFYDLVDFLGLKTLVITDLDSIDSGNNRRKCPVSEGDRSSNQSIREWFSDSRSEGEITLEEIQGKNATEKATQNRRIAYQIPHVEDDPCGRSFEDAFILANPQRFEITGSGKQERESQAWKIAKSVKKSEFALRYAIAETDWAVPRYIVEGLEWLENNIRLNEVIEEDGNG